jgi:hypothetical protein
MSHGLIGSRPGNDNVTYATIGNNLVNLLYHIISTAFCESLEMFIIIHTHFTPPL